MKRLEGKRAIVTGAASGIGRAAARALAQRGARLVCADIAPGLDEALADIRAAGGEVHTRPCDVADEAQVRALVAEACETLGGVDIAVANAGVVGNHAPFHQLDVGDWRRVLEVNLLGSVSLVGACARWLLEVGQPGSLVCTASVAALRAGAGPAPYSASKAALVSFVQNAACQLRGTGVRVNAVCPGLIETEMTRPVFDAARAAGKEDRIGQLNPMLRAGQPPEVAEAIVFLASDDSAYVNGQALVVDGGLSASHPFVPGKLW